MKSLLPQNEHNESRYSEHYEEVRDVFPGTDGKGWVMIRTCDCRTAETNIVTEDALYLHNTAMIKIKHLSGTCISCDNYTVAYVLSHFIAIRLKLLEVSGSITPIHLSMFI